MAGPRRILTLGVVLAAVALGLGAAPAGAYVIGGNPWPTSHLTYSSVGSAHANALVDRAARIWNRAHVGVRFSRAPTERANVLVSGVSGACRGQAYIGYPGTWARASWLYVSRCPSRLMVLVLAHEFGHVLGLGHEMRRCALMNSGVDPGSGTPSRCRRRPLSYWLRHPLMRDDIRGARAVAARRSARP